MVEQTEEFMNKMSENNGLNINHQQKQKESSLHHAAVLSTSPSLNSNQQQYLNTLAASQENRNNVYSPVLSKCNNNGDYSHNLLLKPNIIDDQQNSNIVANKRVGPIQRPTNTNRQQQQQQQMMNSNLFNFSNHVQHPAVIPDDQLLNNLHVWNQQLVEAASSTQIGGNTPPVTTNINTFNLLTNSFTYSQPAQNTFDVWNETNNPIESHIYAPNNNSNNNNATQIAWSNFNVDYLTNFIQAVKPQVPQEQTTQLTTDSLSYPWFTPTNEDAHQFNGINTNAFDYDTLSSAPVVSSTVPWNSVLLNIPNDGNDAMDSSSRATLESLWLNSEHNETSERGEGEGRSLQQGNKRII